MTKMKRTGGEDGDVGLQRVGERVDAAPSRELLGHVQGQLGIHDGHAGRQGVVGLRIT